MTLVANREGWWRGIVALRRAVGEPIGWGTSHGATGHCLNGRHHKCAYGIDGAGWPEVTLQNGDTYACPCRCHFTDHLELP